MSRFYADISGGRGTATRQGHAASGIRGHIRGWRVGVQVIGRADGSDDCFDVYATGGSDSGFGNDNGRPVLLGTVRLDGYAIAPVFMPAVPASFGPCDECGVATVDHDYTGADNRSVCDDCRAA